MKKKSSVRIYIEGGSTGKADNTKFRRNWGIFLKEIRELAQKCGFHSLDIIRGTGRAKTFDRFKNSPTTHPNDLSILLVDSEESCGLEQNVWDFVARRDRWIKPKWATEEHLYFMVATTETWLLTDVAALEDFFVRGFQKSHLPSGDLENRAKDDVDNALKRASSFCKKGPYKHGDAHSIIEKLDPEKVKDLPHGERFFNGVTALIKANGNCPED